MSGIYVDSIKDKSNTKTLATLSSSAVTLDSSVVFPAGHIIQSKFAPSITNSSTGTVTGTSLVPKADVIDQITITSGNGVFIQCQVWLNITANTNAYGTIAISEGTVASAGAVLEQTYFGSEANEGLYWPAIIWAYDSSPADTTPDYVISIATASGNTTSVNIVSTDATKLSITLQEVKQ